MAFENSNKIRGKSGRNLRKPISLIEFIQKVAIVNNSCGMKPDEQAGPVKPRGCAFSQEIHMR
jgi:hypothetical protein